MRYLIVFVTAIVLVSASAASAQTNLGITGGVLLPIGDLDDVADVSPYIGARWEIQDVSPMGNAVVLSFLVQGGFAFLQTDPALEAALAALGISDDGTYFDVGAGVRVYATANPLFLSAGASFINLDPAGAVESSSGVGLHVGVGFALAEDSFKLDIEARGNLGLLEGGGDIEHVQLLASFGLPF
ncbi:MAG: hypothetical protein ACE5EO_10055 [Candidatus Krumholzibacteriia bacterium]